MSKFKFELGQEVTNKVSDERGEIIGRAEYTHSESSYYVRYRAGDGRAVDSWWCESSIV